MPSRSITCEDGTEVTVRWQRGGPVWLAPLSGEAVVLTAADLRALFALLVLASRSAYAPC